MSQAKRLSKVEKMMARAGVALSKDQLLVNQSEQIKTLETSLKEIAGQLALAQGQNNGLQSMLMVLLKFHHAGHAVVPQAMFEELQGELEDGSVHPVACEFSNGQCKMFVGEGAASEATH